METYRENENSSTVTEREAAQRLGFSLPTLRRWRYAKTGPTHITVGRSIRYLPADLDRFLAAHRSEDAN
jgi:predicted DNA-binding transcriptional regulator AlpA